MVPLSAWATTSADENSLFFALTFGLLVIQEPS